jgi:WhiB family redox-sensing transcriptional regulator
VCRSCPVRFECLADALDNRIEFGVWGGMTERERRALLRRHPTVRSWRAVFEAALKNQRTPATAAMAG